MNSTRASRCTTPRYGPEHIIGVLYSKDLMRWMRYRLARLTANRPARIASNLKVQHIMREVLVVPETKPLTDLLEEFKRRKRHLAVVVDEFGSTAGVVTVEDVLEQLVGEIEDEYDVPEQSPLTPGGTSMVLDGGVNIRDLESQYQIRLPRDEGFETLGGFVMSKLQRIPHEGDSFEYHGYRYTVIEMEGRRIDSIKLDLARTARAQGADRLMFRYLAQRVAYTVPVVWLVVSVVFLLIHLVPGDPIQQMLGEGAAVSDLQAARHAYGLDVPIGKQYVNYWKGVLHGDLGQSVRLNQNVSKTIVQAYPPTIALTFSALVIALLLSIPAGVHSALHRNQWSDRLLSFVTLLGLSFPELCAGTDPDLVFCHPTRAAAGFRHRNARAPGACRRSPWAARWRRSWPAWCAPRCSKS